MTCRRHEYRPRRASLPVAPWKGRTWRRTMPRCPSPRLGGGPPWLTRRVRLRSPRSETRTRSASIASRHAEPRPVEGRQGANRNGRISACDLCGGGFGIRRGLLESSRGQDTSLPLCALRVAWHRTLGEQPVRWSRASLLNLEGNAVPGGSRTCFRPMIPPELRAGRRSSAGQAGRPPGAAPATVAGERRGPAIHNATDQSPSAAMTTGMSGRYEPVVSKAIAPTYTASVPPTG